MESMQPFESLVPRLSAVETDLISIRRDLGRAIAAATYRVAEEAPTPQAAPAAIPPTPAPKAAQPEVATAPPPAPRKPALTAGDVESILAGKWLHVVGLFLVFIGTAFFLKVAFDHNWIAPVFRVALGVVAGATAIVYAQHLANKGQVYFSEGITALGAGIEFLSLYASNALFHLASPALALTGMIAVNAAIASLAWKRRSQRLGILAAIGGFLAPLLAGTQGADQWMLAGYIGMLDIGLLVLAELIDSRVIAPIALGGTILYELGSFSQAQNLGDFQRASIYAILYATFAVSGWIVTKVRGRLDPARAIVGGIALGAVMIGLETSLSAHRTLLAEILLGLAVAHLAVAALFKSRYHSWLAAIAITFAIPAAFDNLAIRNAAWAAEAVALSIAGLRFRDDVLKFGGLCLLGLDIAADFAYWNYTAVKPILNERFASCAATFFATYVIARATELNGTSRYDEALVRTLRTAGHALALVTLSAEAWDAVAYYHGSAQASSSALSIVWALFAALLIGKGLVGRDSFMRWEGLGLMILTASKVLLFDLSALDISYRVISAVLVGVALIGVSYAYQRRLSHPEPQP